jgi:DNA-binding transcriptional LysR family regulator
MALELQQLRQIVALAEHGSFVRAAAAQHISQPALSRSVQVLEQRLGSSLFTRSKAGVVPTDLGRLYLERARDVLRLADELESQAQGHASLNAGRVDVGGGPFPSDTFLATAAARLADQYPKLGVRLHSSSWDDMTRQLRSRELDFFVGEFSLLGREADLEVLPLPTRHQAYFFARAGHPLEKRRPIPKGEVFAWPFVTPSRLPPRVLDPLLTEQRNAIARGLPARLWPSIECTGLATLKRIVANSDTVSASILASISFELESGRFVLLGTEPWLSLQYGIVSLRGRPLSQAASKMRDLVLVADQEVSDLEASLTQLYAPDGARRRQKPATRSKTQ